MQKCLNKSEHMIKCKNIKITKNQFDVSSLLEAYDHIVSVHNFGQTQTVNEQKYIFKDDYDFFYSCYWNFIL